METHLFRKNILAFSDCFPINNTFTFSGTYAYFAYTFTPSYISFPNSITAACILYFTDNVETYTPFLWALYRMTKRRWWVIAIMKNLYTIRWYLMKSFYVERSKNFGRIWERQYNNLRYDKKCPSCAYNTSKDENKLNTIY